MDVESALVEGLRQHRAGRLDRARHNYSAVLQKAPDHPEANHLLGLIALQQGDAREAVLRIRKAVDADPGFGPYHLNLGNAYCDAGAYKEAAECYRRALSCDARLTIGLFNLANALQRQGNSREACAAYEAFLRVHSDHAAAHGNFGQALWKENRREEAVAHLKQALALDPSLDWFRLELGIELHQCGNAPEAVPYLEKFLKRHPNHPAALYTLGMALLQMHMTAEAAQYFRQCISLQPTVAEYYCALAEAHWRSNRFRLAQSAAHVALKLKPDYPDAQGLHAIAAIAGKNLTDGDARRLVEEAQTWKNVRLLGVLAGFLVFNGHKQHGLEILSRIEGPTTPPGERVKNATLLPVIIPSREEIGFWRRRFEDGLDRLLKEGVQLAHPLGEVGRTNFYLAYHGQDDRLLQEKVARLYVAACPSLTWEAPHCRTWRDRPAAGRLRIGVVSRHLAFHTIGKLNRGWIERLNRSLFHVTVFQIPRSTRQRDPFSSRIASTADHAVVLPHRLEAMRESIASEELDLLFYPDIGMDPYTYFLAFARLAPVQCVTWGHPVTTGIPSLDYFVSSRELDPPGNEAHYTEKLVRFDELGVYFHRPGYAENMPRTLLTEYAGTRLYVCVQTLFKLHPGFDSMLAAILRADPEGRLVFIRGQEEHMEMQIRARFARSFPDVVDRVVFVPPLSQARFFELLTLADVLLDTPFFGGGNTSYEAFSVAAPVVTLDRPLMRERITPALYRQMGMEDLIASTPEHYTALALRCAQDRDWRERVRDKIRRLSPRIYENERAVRLFERFFLRAVGLARAGAAPQLLNISLEDNDS